MNHTRFATVLIACALFPSAAWSATKSFIAGRDTTVFENSTNSSGGAAGIFVGASGTPLIRRGLLSFDLQGQIPAGSSITGVELSMYLANAPNATSRSIGLHRMLIDWTEGSAGAGNPAVSGTGNGSPTLTPASTWEFQLYQPSPPPASTSWSAPGATNDFVGVSSSTANVGGPIDMQHKWLSTASLIADVQGWIDNPASNFGWALVNGAEATGQSVKAFYSSNASLTNGGTGVTPLPDDWKPLLTITYIPEPSTLILCGIGTTLAIIWRKR